MEPGNREGIRDVATGRFLPNNVANPSGRPKQSEEYLAFVASLQTYSPKAVQYVKEVIENPKISPGEAFNYVKLLLSYAWGQPTQIVDIDADIKSTSFVVNVNLESRVPGVK